MKKLANPRPKDIIIYVFIDIFCVGVGMGVPFFCILLGFPLGWYLTQKLFVSKKSVHILHRQVLIWSFWASAVTFLLMLIVWGVWGGMISALYNTSFDYQNFGHPFILFDPKASFIGWFVLMVFISPFLQLLTTVFSSFVFLAFRKKG